MTTVKMAANLPTVLVTGASGYIATHLVQQLLQAGYVVRGTVRDLNNQLKVEPLRQLYPQAEHRLELYEADLLKPDSWLDAVRGCTYVMHTASPVPLEIPTDPQELIKPAVEGTLSVLRACVEAEGIKRVVLTSSVAAINGGTDNKTSNRKFSESDWTDPDKTQVAYSQSKATAEKAAWDFVHDLPDDKKFELVTINPCVVVGPVLCGGYTASMQLPKHLLSRTVPLLPYCSLNLVDVRDVAAAHIASMTSPHAAGYRHILATQTLWMQDIAHILKDEFAPLGYNVPTWCAPYLLAKFASFWDKRISFFVGSWGIRTEYETTRMTDVLGIKPRSIKESLIEMAHSMIKNGFIKKL